MGDVDKAISKSNTGPVRESPLTVACLPLSYSGSTQDTRNHCEYSEKKVMQGTGFMGEGRGGWGHLERSRSVPWPWVRRRWERAHLGKLEQLWAHSHANGGPRHSTNEDTSICPQQADNQGLSVRICLRAPGTGCLLHQVQSGSCCEQGMGSERRKSSKYLEI